MRRHLIVSAASLLTAIFAGQTGFASGFEKSIPFGGQTSGVAGIGSSYMQGSQALFFNPAGLAGDKTGSDVSLNVSPTSPSWKAPILSTSTQESSTSKMLTPFGLMYGNTLNDKLGFGVGVYTSGGTYADYTNLKFTTGSTLLEAKTDLTIMEMAAGVGYKVMDGLKIGASWRVATVSGALNVVSPAGGGAGLEKDLKDLKDTNYTGFKLGAQYRAADKTDIGFTYRSEMNFHAKGTIGAHTSIGTTPLADTDVKVGTTFPAAWTLGVSHQCLENWKFLAEYVYTEYSKVKNLAVEFKGTSNPFELQWKDQHNLRLGGEYKGFSWPVRFGYIWTSKVTDADHSLPTLTPPGTANTLTLGTGQEFGSFRVDGGLEYTMASGAATGMTADNSVTEYALHLGGAYTF